MTNLIQKQLNLEIFIPNLKQRRVTNKQYKAKKTNKKNISY